MPTICHAMPTGSCRHIGKLKGFARTTPSTPVSRAASRAWLLFSKVAFPLRVASAKTLLCSSMSHPEPEVSSVSHACVVLLTQRGVLMPHEWQHHHCVIQFLRLGYHRNNHLHALTTTAQLL
jgi:hypothetical protein